MSSNQVHYITSKDAILAKLLDTLSTFQQKITQKRDPATLQIHDSM